MKKLLGLAVFSSMLLQMTACIGGKSSSSGSGINPDIMNGVAATGAPISNGAIEIKGRNGVIVRDTTASDGSYSANIAALEEPYLVRVVAPSGEKYISVASQSDLGKGKKINVTPLSHTIVANVFEEADADELFDNFEVESNEFTEGKLEDEKDKLVQKFIDAGLLGDGKIASADIDFLNGDLKAGTSIGLDGLLDVIEVNTGSSSGVEIKLKGQAAPFITDQVINGIGDSAVVSVSASVDSAKAQLSVIDAIRKQMNALAAKYSSLGSCNGPAVDDGSLCDVDNLHTALLPFFHADFQEEGMNREAAVWKWVCEKGDEDAASKSECLISGEVEFETVYLKDITLINLHEGTNTALISLNVYENGKLGKSEEMTLKLDVGDGKYKLIGNRKTFKYWIDTESVHSTELNKSNDSKVESYDVNLNFYYKNSGAHTFNGSESFTLTAASGHGIFPGGLDSMALYLVKAPVYENDSCSAGLAFSTTSTPYKIYDHANGTSSMANFDSACVTSNDPCNCLNGATLAQFDFESSRLVKLGPDEIIKMDKFEKINLVSVGAGIDDSFVIKKPMIINAINAAIFVPQFGIASSALCHNTDLAMSLNLSVGSGTLSDVSLHYGASNGGTWQNESSRENLWDLDLTTKLFSPVFEDLAVGDTIQHTHLYLGSRDEFDRRFVRRVNCFN